MKIGEDCSAVDTDQREHVRGANTTTARHALLWGIWSSPSKRRAHKSYHLPLLSFLSSTVAIVSKFPSFMVL